MNFFPLKNKFLFYESLKFFITFKFTSKPFDLKLLKTLFLRLRKLDDRKYQNG